MLDWGHHRRHNRDKPELARGPLSDPSPPWSTVGLYLRFCPVETLDVEWSG
jgi:hypothetical protein